MSRRYARLTAHGRLLIFQRARAGWKQGRHGLGSRYMSRDARFVRYAGYSGSSGPRIFARQLNVSELSARVSSGEKLL